MSARLLLAGLIDRQRERNWLIEQLQHFARAKHIRVSFLSGDVHCAAVGVLKTYVKGKKDPDIPPAMDYRYMLNVVTSKLASVPDMSVGSADVMLPPRCRRDCEHTVRCCAVSDGRVRD